MPMKRALLLLLLLPGLALAHTFTFTWTDPTSRTDGSALNPATELKSYRMQCSGPENAERIVDRAATSAAHAGSRALWASDGAMQFDGVSDVVNTGFPVGSIAGRSFNIEAIVQYAGTVERTWTPIFGANSDVNRLFIGKGNETDSLVIWMGGLGSFGVSGTGLFDGQERRLSIAFDDAANEVRVSVDGVVVNTEANVSGSFSATGDLLIGGVGHDTNQRWIGTVRDVRVSGTTSDRDRQYVWTDAVQADGTYACRMTAVDTGDRESAWSDIASVAKEAAPVVPAAPSAPTDLRGQ